MVDASEIPRNPLRAWREERALSLVAAATRLGYRSKRSVQALENGDHVPTLELLEELAAKIGQDPDELILAWARWWRSVRLTKGGSQGS